MAKKSSLSLDISQGSFCGPDVNTGATLSDVYIIPLKDLNRDATQFNTTDKCIIEALSMIGTGSRAFKYTAVDGSISSNATIVQRDSLNDVFRHDVTFALTANTEAERREIEKLLREDVAVAYQKTNGEITVLGYDSGLRLSGDFVFTEGGENADQLVPTLSTREPKVELNKGYSLFITDAATSLAVLESLLNEVV